MKSKSKGDPIEKNKLLSNNKRNYSVAFTDDSRIEANIIEESSDMNNLKIEMMEKTEEILTLRE